MSVGTSLDKRRQDWERLEVLMNQLAKGKIRGEPGSVSAEISSLYRAACADLSMADQYRLSPDTVAFLHNLVGRAHNTIYRSRRFQYQLWFDVAFREAPRRIFADPCVHLCGLLFFGLFSFTAVLAVSSDIYPDFPMQVLGADHISQMEQMYGDIEFDRSIDDNLAMVAFYIQHNTSIGLECFAYGPLVIPGLYATAYNATFLGTTFGYMARGDTPGGESFLEFVTAHGAFELTAIALAAAAGLRIGSGWLITSGLSRIASLQLQARKALPVMSVSAVLFLLAAFTEGLISPSSLPYVFKAMWGMFSSSLLMYYFIVLGYPTEASNAA
ncbi:MAG: stage II sporulation protein M [Planctomycetales bacterium]|nr:stage II sporulation protein M [Planctomycetales bacterium]